MTGHEGHNPNPLFGILLKVLAVAFFICMSASIKAAGDVPAGQSVFFRSFFAFIPLLCFLAWRHELRHAGRTSRPFAHIGRSLAGAIGMMLGFFALPRLPLPDVVTLNYAQPLLVVVLSALILGETVRIYRWGAVVVGFIGVLIVSWPKLTLVGGGAGLSNQELLAVLAVLSNATLSAFAMILVRSLIHTERSSTIVLWVSLTSTTVGLLSIPFGWISLTPWQATLLISAGIFGGVGQILMTEAFRYAEASTVAPFEYTSMLLSILIGYFVFSEEPTAHVIVGGMVVMGAGLFIIWRERQLGIERRKAREVTPPH